MATSKPDDSKAAERASGQAPADSSGQTRRFHRGSDEPAPRRPDERDESADSQASGPRPVVRQAHEDLERGLVDTEERSRAAPALRERLQEDDESATNGREDGQ